MGYVPNGSCIFFFVSARMRARTSTPAALVSGANCPGGNCLTASTAVPSGVTIYTYSAVNATFTLSNIAQNTTYTLVIRQVIGGGGNLAKRSAPPPSPAE
jgi:hypothetical protein